MDRWNNYNISINKIIIIVIIIIIINITVTVRHYYEQELGDVSYDFKALSVLESSTTGWEEIAVALYSTL